MGGVIRHWLPAMCWMGLIFIGSGDTLSAAHTSRFIEPLLRWLFGHLPPESIEAAHHLIRKMGHLTEYAILALLLWRGVLPVVRRRRGPGGDSGLTAAALVWLLATFYAASDEFRQSFVASRGASPRDVLIDSAGAALGMILLWTWHNWRDVLCAPAAQRVN